MYEYNSELYKAWKHGKDGGSIFGAPVNGAFTAWAYSDGRAENTASSAPAPSYTAPASSYTSSLSSPASNFSSSYGGSYSGGGGGSSGYAAGHGGSFGDTIKGVFGFVVIVILVVAFLGGGHAKVPSGGSVSSAPLARTASAFDQGVNDRRAWESWFGGLGGDMRAGANYWASIRNDPNHGTCAGARQASDAFLTGCTNAKKFFDTRRVDARRKGEPDYWSGWNSL